MSDPVDARPGWTKTVQDLALIAKHYAAIKPDVSTIEAIDNRIFAFLIVLDLLGICPSRSTRVR